MSRLPENLPSGVYMIAWVTLYNCFSERQQEEEIKLMDTVLQTVENEYREGLKQHGIIQDQKAS